jgi:thiol-disulfide isomerase/thioredoxin
MKKIILLFIVAIITGINTYAQTIPTRTTFNISRVIDKNTVVLDSAGNRYDYDKWRSMTETGNYRLSLINPIVDGRPNQDPNAPYTIVTFTAQQKAAAKARMGKPRESAYFTTGEVITPFKVKSVQGKKITPEDWAGKTVVLNFWFIGCAPCRQEMPELNKIVAKYANNPNVIFIGVALDQNWDIKDFIKKTPFDYQLVGDGRELATSFGIKSYPTNVVINKEGKVHFHSSGYSLNTPDWIEKSVEESVNGKTAQ